MKTNLIKKIGSSLMFPALALSLLLFSPPLLSNVDNNEKDVVKQDTTLQNSPIIIVGKVVDLDHQPLEGVVVRDNSTTIEKMTDGEGKFELSFDTATMVSFTKIGFYNVDHNVIESDTSLVVILTPESNELIIEGYGSLEDDNNVEGLFENDTTSALKKKYDSMQDTIDNKSMKMNDWSDKMDSTHMNKKNDMHMNMNDSMKNVKEDMWKKDMKHDMDTTKNHKDLNHHKNDTTNNLNNGVIDIK